MTHTDTLHEVNHETATEEVNFKNEQAIEDSHSSKEILEVDVTLEDMDRSKLLVSPAASCSSTKENIKPTDLDPAPTATAAPTPKKKKLNNRNVMSGYKKKRKRNSSGQTTKAKATTTTKRGRPASAASNVSSAPTSSVREKRYSGTRSKAPVDYPNENTKDSSETDEDENDDDEDDEDGVYRVERIDRKQLIDGKAFYFIKWKGWDEKSNTWEPVENLTGCSKLLQKFEQQWAENEKKKRNIAKAKRKRQQVYSDAEDVEKSKRKSKKYMQSYGVYKEWPTDKDPVSVEGVLDVDGILTYVVKKNTRMSSKRHLDRSNAILVHSDGFKILYPQLVIEFYQKRVLWCDAVKDDQEQARVAAEMSLLQKNKESQIGIQISEYIDNEIAKEYPDKDQKEQENKNIPPTTRSEDLETQVIMSEGLNEIDDGLKEDEDLNVEDIDDDVMDDEDETAIFANNNNETDKFGLPKDIENDLDLGSSVNTTTSESENEEAMEQD